MVHCILPLRKKAEKLYHQIMGFQSLSYTSSIVQKMTGEFCVILKNMQTYQNYIIELNWFKSFF